MSQHLDDSFLKKHVKTQGSTEGGACLTRHEPRKENSCSHIWQAYEKAKQAGDKDLYNWPRYESLSGKDYKSGSRITKKGNLFPAGLDQEKTGPQAHEWDVGRGQNFQSWTVPYWHNAHHIIPNGVLASVIADAAGGEWRFSLLIRSGLLGAKYNLNHKTNMVILPMAEEVARALSLPRHLLGQQKTGGSETRSHANYSANVKDKLNGVMNDYLQVLEAKEEDHPAPPNELGRKKLEDCSEEVYEKIKAFGAESPGEALSRMPEEMFA